MSANTGSAVSGRPSGDRTAPPTTNGTSGRGADQASDAESATPPSHGDARIESDDDLAARLRFDPEAGRPSWYRPPRSDQPVDSESARAPRPAAPPRPSRSATPSRPAHTRSAGSQRSAARRAHSRQTSRKIALPVLAGLIVAAVALVGAIAGLTKMVLGSVAGDSAAAAPLAMPAPAYADRLPRLSKASVQPATTLALIAQFRQRFAAATGAASGQPSGQYREPGRLDLATDKPAWVMYVGYNSDASLGAPKAAVLKLMSSLTGNPLPSSSWSIPAGARGGSARCAITKITDISVSICAWATENTFGALMSPSADTKGDELAVLLPQMRLDLQPG